MDIDPKGTRSLTDGPDDLKMACAGAQLPSADDLRRMGEELIGLAEALTPLDDYVRAAETEPAASRDSGSERTLQSDATLTQDLRLAEFAESLYNLRRKRTRHLSAELFGEPAWDMLLDLFVSSVRARRIRVTSLCLAAGVAPTTALRWVAVLIEQGLVERVALAFDRRATEVRLTRAGYETMRRSLTDWLALTRI